MTKPAPFSEEWIKQLEAKLITQVEKQAFEQTAELRARAERIRENTEKLNELLKKNKAK